MGESIKRRGETFWFRRRVPHDAAMRLGMREFACSLRTGSRRDAEARAKAVWLETEKVFTLAASSLAREQALVQLRRIVQEQPWAPSADVEEVGRRAAAGEERDVMAILRHARKDVLVLSPEEQVWIGSIEEPPSAPGSLPQVSGRSWYPVWNPHADQGSRTAPIHTSIEEQAAWGRSIAD